MKRFVNLMQIIQKKIAGISAKYGYAVNKAKGKNINAMSLDIK